MNELKPSLDSTLDQLIQKIVDGLIPGIVSGLLTSLLILIMVLYWKGVLNPYIEKLVYRGVRIDKHKWKVNAETQNKGTAEIVFTQFAHRITGKILWHTQDNKIIEYEIKGEFSDLILTASYKQKDAITLDRGTITLLYKKNGELLEGCYAWYDEDTNDIISGKYTCNPKM